MERCGDMKPKKFQLRKTLSVIDGFFILLLTFLLVNSLAGSGLFPTKFLASILPGGATVINQMLWQQILQFVVMTGLTLLFLFLRGKTLGQIGLRPFSKRNWFWKAIGCGIVLFFVMLFVSALLVSLFPQWAKPQAVTEMIMQAHNDWEWFAVILMVCILAPISEELLFRGYFYHSLRNRYSMWSSVLVASLLFGCIHYDLFRLLPLTFTGICLNLVAIRSGSLWGAIVMHGVWNFMMTLVMMAF